MTYQQAIDFLYTQLPMFTRDGAASYKVGLGNITALCAALQQPHTKFKSIHIAGTNGKGSTSHMLASILQTAGHKVGLYTSPHIKDFRERIRINGEKITGRYVIDFVAKIKNELQHIQPSFFEICVAMAFDYFAQQQVDVAVIEVGLGGLYDSTNIITPILSVITNIGYDHMNLLGNTLPQIASQKAGIIKHKIPVVISTTQPEIEHVFTNYALQQQAPIYFADQVFDVIFTQSSASTKVPIKVVDRNKLSLNTYELDLLGKYQTDNVKGVLMACELLQEFKIAPQHIAHGLSNTKTNTGISGRFDIIKQQPLVICDVAHNYEGISSVLQHVAQLNQGKLHIILGFVADKDISKIVQLLPQTASYYCTQAQIPRALPFEELKQILIQQNLDTTAHKHVNDAYQAALSKAAASDTILVIGSFFILAELDI